jgi:hypothetical protein
VAVVMDILNLFANYSNSIIAFFNIILIYFVFLQLRDARKPIIITGIISGDKEITERPDVLESGKLYLEIINDSKNIAQAINIEYKFNFNGRSVNVKEKDLSHLNPEEATSIILKSIPIRKKYPDLFEEITEGNITKIIPKETLKIDLIVTIHYNPLFRSLFKYNLEDNYLIEWGSRKSYPNFGDLPVFQSWNKRNNEYYIYKTGGRKSLEREYRQVGRKKERL